MGQRGRHHKILARQVDVEILHERHVLNVLLAHEQDRYVLDVEFMLLNQMQEQIEGPLESRKRYVVRALHRLWRIWLLFATRRLSRRRRAVLLGNSLSVLLRLHFQDASEQQEKFIIPFWPDGTLFKQWSGIKDGYGDVFATLSELSISNVNSGKARIVFCFMDKCSRDIDHIIPYILTQSKKYGIKESGIWYVTNELAFKEEYEIWNKKYNKTRNAPKFNVIAAPYFWDKSPRHLL